MRRNDIRGLMSLAVWYEPKALIKDVIFFSRKKSGTRNSL